MGARARPALSEVLTKGDVPARIVDTLGARFNELMQIKYYVTGE